VLLDQLPEHVNLVFFQVVQVDGCDAGAAVAERRADGARPFAVVAVDGLAFARGIVFAIAAASSTGKFSVVTVWARERRPQPARLADGRV
jgi:hypothetical protein